jgi:hypothetical protein
MLNYSMASTELSSRRHNMRSFRPSLEPLEPKTFPTLVFLFSGNAFAEAKPNLETQVAADQLIRAGDQAIQLSTPAMDGPDPFYQVAQTIRVLSQGRPIGLMGFSAGGAVAMRLAGLPGLNVQAVLNFYGPPDLQNWLNYHFGDRYYRFVTSHVRLTPSFVRLMTGPSSTSAYIVNAFGLRDRNIVASESTSSFYQDFQHGAVFYYAGPHGVTSYASIPAFRDFLAHL